MDYRDEQTNDVRIVKRRPTAPDGTDRSVNRNTAMERPVGTTRSIRQAKEATQERAAAEERRQVRRTVRPTGEIPAEGVRRTTRATGEIPAEGVRRTTRVTGEIPAEGVRRTARPTGEIPAEGVRRTTRPTGEIPRSRPSAEQQGTAPRRSSAEQQGAASRRPSAEQNTAARRPSAEQQRAARRPSAEQQNTAVRRPSAPQRKPQKSGHGLHIVAGILMALVIVAVAAVFILRGGSSGRVVKAVTTDLNEYYALGEGEARLVLNGTTNELRGYVSEGEFYAPYELVQNTLNNRIYYAAAEQILLYTLDSETIEIPIGSNTYTKNGETIENGSAVVVLNGETPYISMTFVQNFTKLTYSTFTDPNRLVIVTDGTTLPEAEAKSTEVKESADNGAVNMTVLEKGEPVWIMEEGENWCHIMSQTGIAGYVKTKKLGDIKEHSYSFDMEEPEFHSIHKDYGIRMAWHQVMGAAGNDTLGTVISGANINTIAPTWFFLTDTSGNIASLASAAYVQQAHAAGIEVWAVVNDFDGEYLYGGPNSAEATLNLLSSTSTRRTLINNLINESVAAGVDGINVDFEKVNEECGSHYIQFIRELSVACGKNNLVLSVNSYVPSAWTVQYHREEQNLYADYVVIMAYDENGSWSQDIGPNSSLNYVEDAIADTLKVVDADKMILGVPFYTRLWWESTDAAEAVTNGFSCNTLTMQEQAQLLASRAYDSNWDEERGTNMITYEEGGNRYTLWVENADSLKLKLDAMRSSGLAGFSAWKLGQETSDVWSVLGQY